MSDIRPYGYVLPCCYIGFNNGKQQEYPTEKEYLEMFEEEQDEFENLLNAELAKLKANGKEK